MKIIQIKPLRWKKIQTTKLWIDISTIKSIIKKYENHSSIIKINNKVYE